MAKKNRKIERFKAQLAALQGSVPEDLHLPSLRHDRLDGYAALFMMVLPLLNAQGEPVFTEPLLQELFLVLENPIEATNEFFTRLKQILKTAGNIEQEEILVSRIECRLL